MSVDGFALCSVFVGFGAFRQRSVRLDCIPRGRPTSRPKLDISECGIIIVRDAWGGLMITVGSRKLDDGMERREHSRVECGCCRLLNQSAPCALDSLVNPYRPWTASWLRPLGVEDQRHRFSLGGHAMTSTPNPRAHHATGALVLGSHLPV